jgi:hypothetical protein
VRENITSTIGEIQEVDQVEFRQVNPSILHHQLDPIRREARGRGDDRAAVGRHVDALDHQQRPAGRHVQARRVDGVGDRRGDPGAVAPIVADAGGGERAGNRAGRLADFRGPGVPL